MHHASSVESAESVITRAGLSPAITPGFYISLIINRLILFFVVDPCWKKKKKLLEQDILMV